MDLSEEDTVKMFMHQMNHEAKSLNKDIIQKSATMQDIPLQQEIYKQQQPQPQQPRIVPPPHVSQVAPQQVNTDPALLNNLIERVSSVEKQITKFVSLIEKRVAKNAKEINIRIKLDNDSANKE